MITTEKLIKILSQELAYHQIMADCWFYLSKDSNMSSKHLDDVTELKNVISLLDLPIDKVYEEAKKIYDFTDSGKKDFVPDLDNLRRLRTEFCEKFQKERLI